MIDTRKLEDLAERIAALLPADVQLLRDEFKSNLRALLESTFARIDLVTRNEFDAQAVVLARAREKLERLEGRLIKLERDLEAAAKD